MLPAAPAPGPIEHIETVDYVDPITSEGYRPDTVLVIDDPEGDEVSE